MAPLREALSMLLDHADQRLPSGLYVAVSVTADRTRDRLRRSRRPFCDPAVAELPPLADVDETARWVIYQSALAAMTLGGFASFAGAVSVPPETLAQAIGLLRLAQRLTVVYGFDPETDRGQMAVWQALSAGLDVQLPTQGPMQVRLRDVPQILVPQPDLRSAGVVMTRAVLKRTAWQIAGKFSRLVPVISPGISAVVARRRTEETGQRMQGALRRLAEVPPELRFVDEAVEV